MRQRPVSSLEQYGITRWEYRELYAFCRQYQYKKAKARDLLGVSSHAAGRAKRGGSVGRPTESAVVRRIRILEDIEIIERAAHDTAEGLWYTALISNCCIGRPYTAIPPEQLPTSNRNDFFRARREFFLRLYQLKNEKEKENDTRGDMDS